LIAAASNFGRKSTMSIIDRRTIGSSMMTVALTTRAGTSSQPFGQVTMPAIHLYCNRGAAMRWSTLA